MLQFSMVNEEINQFSSRVNIFSKTLKDVLSIGNMFGILKTPILGIINTEEGIS